MAECIDRGTAIAKLTALEVAEPNATMADAKRVLADIPAADVATVVPGRIRRINRMDAVKFLEESRRMCQK